MIEKRGVRMFEVFEKGNEIVQLYYSPVMKMYVILFGLENEDFAGEIEKKNFIRNHYFSTKKQALNLLKDKGYELEERKRVK